MGRGRPQGHELSDESKGRISNSMRKYWCGPEGAERAAAMRLAAGDIDWPEYLSRIAGLGQDQRHALLADGSLERARQALADSGPTGRAIAANLGWPLMESDVKRIQRILQDNLPEIALMGEAIRIAERWRDQ